MTLPRRTRPNSQKRINTAFTTRAAQSMQGRTASARPRDGRARTVQESQFEFDVIEHGDDPDAARSPAKTVQWKGPATPANGNDYDFRYPA
jgi:hypothetical protein